MKSITLDEQLKNKANFISGGKLYLVRCMQCGDSKRGRENYAGAVASGMCAWCGWSEKLEGK